MKKAFSLIEVIFIILLLGIVATVAIPKLGSLTSKAKVNTIKQDINTVITSVQNYVAINGSISKFSDAVSLDKTVWSIGDDELKFIDKANTCVTITLDEDQLDIDIAEDNNGDICKGLRDSGIEDQTIELQ